MERAADMMDGISLHYYTVPGPWTEKTHALGFSEQEWYDTMRKTQYMDTLITRHSKIMDQYDPERRIGLLVDEWGMWHLCEEGTNPGFLYQQNSLRDALVAGINLNIFNQHCDRVRMANIAQLVNVLQSVILTEGEKMILTPTYHVFCMYREHQNARKLAAWMQDVPEVQDMASVTASASIKDGQVLITLCNIDLENPVPMEICLRGGVFTKAEAQVLTAEVMDEHNTFEEPDRIQPRALTADLVGDIVKLTLPPKSVTALHLA